MQKVFISPYIIIFLSVGTCVNAQTCQHEGKTVNNLTIPTISTFTTLNKTTEASKNRKERKRKSKRMALKIFVWDNLENVTEDIVSGEGESLNSLAEIAQIPKENEKCFFGILKRNFDEIFPDTNTGQKHIFMMIRGFIKGYVKNAWSLR
jgi:hypothetical protein